MRFGTPLSAHKNGDGIVTPFRPLSNRAYDRISRGDALTRLTNPRLLRLALSVTAVGIVTWMAYVVIPVNPTTVGFAYLLLVLAIASTWGFLEAAVSSVLATLVFNFYFFEPKFTFTIADPQNWIALFSFLATSLVGSQLSTKARQRASEAIEKQRDLERLYS